MGGGGETNKEGSEIGRERGKEWERQTDGVQSGTQTDREAKTLRGK